MKKKIIFFSIVALGMFAGTSVTQNAYAVAASLHVDGCQTNDQNGGIIALGNTCSTGKSSCKSNPCPPAN